MSTRYKTESQVNFGQGPLPSGYEKSGAGVSALTIPSCGIEDVDIAIFNLFDKEVDLHVTGPSNSIIKVPVIFAAGEKWALLKNNRPLRDRNNTLILPLMTVMRTEVTQTSSDDIMARGINQQVGEIVIKRRLDKTDREYQSLVNRLLIPNQANLMVAEKNTYEGQPSTGRDIGSLTQTIEQKDGAYLRQDRLNNIYETIVIPTPQFYTAKYQVTVWTQYTQHANQIVEKVITSLLPQNRSWKLTTPKGYWFIARFEDGSLASESSFDDMSQQERFIKHTFDVTVPAYFFAPDTPGAPIPIKRYISAPVISFKTLNASITAVDYEQESKYVIGSDDPTLPLDDVKNVRRDQRSIGWRQQKIYPAVPDNGKMTDPILAASYNDPAVKSSPQQPSAKYKNLKGETVYSGDLMGDLQYIMKSKIPF